MCVCVCVRACMHVFELVIHAPLQDFGIPNFKVGFIVSCGSAVTTACSKMDIFYDVGFLCKVRMCPMYTSVHVCIFLYMYVYNCTYVYVLVYSFVSVIYSIGLL